MSEEVLLDNRDVTEGLGMLVTPIVVEVFETHVLLLIYE